MKKNIISFLLSGILLLSFGTIIAKDFCPENVQAVIIIKVLGYTNKIGGVEKENLTVGILNGGAMVDLLKKTSANSGKKITVKEINVSNLDGIDIIYIPKGTSDSDIKKVTEEAKKKKIFTIAGDPAFMDNYSITFNVYLENQKPKLLVDMGSSENEGVSFSSELLKISQRK